MQEVGFVYYYANGIVKPLYSATLFSQERYDRLFDYIARTIFNFIKEGVKNEM
jgi:hypothetical protein